MMKLQVSNTNNEAQKSLNFVTVHSKRDSSVLIYEAEFFSPQLLGRDYFHQGNREIVQRKLILVHVLGMHR